MRFQVILFAFSSLACLAPFPAHARWANETDAEAATDFQNLDIDVRADGTYTMRVDEQVEILKDSARGTRGILRVEYNARSTTLKILRAGTINDGKFIPVPTEHIEDKPLASSGLGFDQRNQVMIAFPQVRIGSKIALQYERVFKEAPIPGFFSMSLDYGTYEPEKSGTVHIRSALPLFIDVNDPEKNLSISHSGKKSKDGVWTLDVKLKSPAFKRPIEEEYSLLANREYPWVNVSSSTDWADMARPLIPRYEETLKAPLPESFARIVKDAKKKTSTIDRINVVTSRLADEVHYMGDWRPVQGGHLPRALATIASTRFGDCKDFSVSTAAMLRALGLQADVAWVYRSSRPVISSHKLPRDELFNHAIVHAIDPADGKTHWIDPTNMASFAQGIFEDIIHRPSLVLNAKAPKLEMIPDGRPEDTGLFAKMNVNLADSLKQVPVKGELTIAGRDATAWAGALLNHSKDSLKYELVKWLASGQAPKTWKMDDFDLSSRITRDVSFRFEYVENGNGFKSSAGPAYFLPKMGYIDALLLNADNRVSDFYLGLPATNRRVYRLQNIQRVGSESMDCSIESRWVTAQRAMEEDSDGVKLTDTFTIRQGLIPVKDLKSAEFTKLQSELRRCFGSVAMIYRPRGQSTAP